MPKPEKKRDIWTTIAITRSNLELAKKLLPAGAKFKFWINEFLREKLLAELYIKEHGN